MKIYAVAMEKGGTGKMTTAAALSQAARFKGMRVLVVDLDPQGDLSFILGANDSLQGSYELLQGAAIHDTIQTTAQGLDLIASDKNLATLTTVTGSANRLKKALEPIKEKYDAVFIDTTPTIGELYYNALNAATDIIIPLQADTLNLKNLTSTISTARQLRPDLEHIGIIFTANSERTTIARQMQEGIISAATASGAVWLGDVRKCVAVKESQAMQESLYQYAPRCTAAVDYMAILEKI